MATEADVRKAYEGIGRTNVSQDEVNWWMNDPNFAKNFATAAGDTQTQANAAKIDSGYVSPEVKAAYLDPNLFNRQADTAGGNYWTQQGLVGSKLTDAMKAAADAKAAKAENVISGNAVSGYVSANGLRFDANGNPINNTVKTPDVTKNEPETSGDISVDTHSYDAVNAPTTAKADVSTYTAPLADASVGNISKDSLSSFDPTTANGGLATASTPTKDQLATYKASPDAVATATEFDPTQGTVAGQIKSLIDSGSPLMKRAQDEAKLAATQGMAERGLMNSSMALQATQLASEDALFKYATQIGALDAAAYNDRMAKNKAALDQFALTNKAANDRANELTTTTINALLESNAMRETDVAKLNATLKNTAMQLKMAAENDAIFKNAAAKISVSLANAGFENAAAAFGAGAQNAASTQYTANQQQTNLVNANAANAAAAANADAQNKAGIVAASLLSAQTIAKMDDGTKRYLADTQAKYQTLIAASGAASSLSSATMNALNGIAESNMGDDAKRIQYNATVNNYNTAMNLIGSINGVNLTGLLNFQTIQ